MQKGTLTIIALLAGIIVSVACGNFYYSMDRHGRFHDQLDFSLTTGFNTNFNIGLNERRLRKSLAALEKDSNYMHLSDYSLALMNLGKADVALTLLKNLFAKYPTEYRLASNLGTAYELNGDDVNALKFIKKGLELNPADHAGSEWVHVKILEAKLQMADDPDFLDKNFILNLSQEQKQNPDVARQIDIQVRERFPFTPKGSKLLSVLMEEMADCFAESISVEYAVTCYRIARDYHNGDETRLNEKIGALKTVKRKQEGELSEEQKAKSRLDASPMRIRPTDHLLDDNNREGEIPNWENINTNAAELLAMVNLQLDPEALKEQEAAKNAGEGDLQFLPDETEADAIGGAENVAKAQLAPEEDNNEQSWFMMVLGAIASSLVAVIVVSGMRKRKS